MIYTFQRRRTLNKVIRDMFPDIKFEEDTDGVPMLKTYRLPEKAMQVTEISELLRIIDQNCSIERCGMVYSNTKSVLPIFIETRDISRAGERIYWRVNYVMCTEQSKREAAKYVEKGKLFICT